MTENELLKQEVAQMIISLVSGTFSEEEENNLLEEISKLSPDPEWSDYIFWSDEYNDSDGNLDINAVVQKIFSYKVIKL